MSESLYDIPLQKIDGSKATLGEHKGNVLLVVNVASKCGLTPQYTGLEKLHESYRDKGFAVVGFPANDFGAQEPGTNAEIQQFCTTNFGVQFPMYSKIQVTGDGKHPLYRHLTTRAAEDRESRRHGDPAEGLRHDADERARGALELREVPRRSQRPGRRPLRARHGPRRRAARARRSRGELAKH